MGYASLWNYRRSGRTTRRHRSGKAVLRWRRSAVNRAETGPTGPLLMAAIEEFSGSSSISVPPGVEPLESSRTYLRSRRFAFSINLDEK